MTGVARCNNKMIRPDSAPVARWKGKMQLSKTIGMIQNSRIRLVLILSAVVYASDRRLYNRLRNVPGRTYCSYLREQVSRIVNLVYVYLYIVFHVYTRCGNRESERERESTFLHLYSPFTCNCNEKHRGMEGEEGTLCMSQLSKRVEQLAFWFTV